MAADPNQTRRSIIANASGAMLAACSLSTAFGQTRQVPVTPLPPGTIRPNLTVAPPPPLIPPEHVMGAQDGRDTVMIATTRPLLAGGAPVLSGFRFGFLNGDHKLRRVAILPKEDHFEAAFADSNSDDPFRAEGRWWRFAGVGMQSVSAAVRGVADIDIPPGPPNTTLVLCGFEFRRANGSDANVRTLALRLNGPDKKIRVALLDDQNPDFTGLATALAAGLAFGAFSPDPATTMMTFGGSTVIADRAMDFVQSGGTDGTRARSYAVVVNYAWVPTALLTDLRMVSGSGRNYASVSGRRPRGTEHVLRGFMFHFGNSDHYIRDIGVHLGGQILSNATGDVVSWQDGNQDDPIQWVVDIAELAERR